MQRLFVQFLRFLGISGIGWILDFITYTCLGFFSKNLVLNNTISSWIGVTFVFIFSTRKVFENQSKISLKWKYLIYLLYQCILIFLVSKLLNGVNSFIIQHIAIAFIIRFSPIISKIAVTPFTMVLNYFVMKIIIEKL